MRAGCKQVATFDSCPSEQLFSVAELLLARLVVQTIEGRLT